MSAAGTIAPKPGLATRVGRLAIAAGMAGGAGLAGLFILIAIAFSGYCGDSGCTPGQQAPSALVLAGRIVVVAFVAAYLAAWSALAGAPGKPAPSLTGSGQRPLAILVPRG